MLRDLPSSEQPGLAFVFESEPLAIDADDDRVVQDAIEHRDGEHAIYIGEIRHKQECHPGQHQPILEREIWDRVQAQLRSGARRDGEPATKAPSSLLAGRLFDEKGDPLYVQGAAKGGRRYRYYVSRDLVRGTVKDGQRGWRVSALELERAVLSAARSIFGDQAALVASLRDSGGEPENVEHFLFAVSTRRERLNSESDSKAALVELVKRVQLGEMGLRVTVNAPVTTRT